MTTENTNRIAGALERIADALERIPTITVGEFDLAACDDRTCTARDHWAPVGRVNHGSTPTTCAHGQDHPDDLECEYHDNPLRVGEFHVSSLETGKPVRVVVTNRRTGAILFDGDLAKLPADLDLPQGGWSADDLVQPMADPLDESDHRPRHVSGSEHLWWSEDCGRWHVLRREGGCTCNGRDPHIRPLTPADPLFRLEWWADGDTLTFCDCPDDATIEAENGATD